MGFAFCCQKWRNTELEKAACKNPRPFNLIHISSKDVTLFCYGNGLWLSCNHANLIYSWNLYANIIASILLLWFTCRWFWKLRIECTGKVNLSIQMCFYCRNSIEQTKIVILPELVELARDEGSSVRIAAFDTIVNLLVMFDSGKLMIQCLQYDTICLQ